MGRHGACPCGADACTLRRAVIPVEEALALFAERLADTLDLREHGTGLHSRRVACHTLVLARHVLDDPDALRQVYFGALLHDVGKIGIPDRVLCKPGPLDEEEWGLMRRHPELGWGLLAGIQGMEAAAELVLCHHERWDGAGYPRGLRGAGIPLGARLFAVIDALDAMVSRRAYGQPRDFEAACGEIAREAGRAFDPEAVALFTKERETLAGMVEAACAARPPEAPQPWGGGRSPPRVKGRG
ncbi:HD-GYP domain-containing protein [Inmirania thermothiophila]|uniref:HD domain-containing protein n=1 Tax=Inmirania thermothiophila TaxID=1750597 RepID=A0A3N1Y6K9_9GAMM|nr:HD domain-containing phosphohydrolase [Inmirania thermothiophila]ROR34390.1 HD domain-containing protein [Inmirania thermothiophila]